MVEWINVANVTSYQNELNKQNEHLSLELVKLNEQNVSLLFVHMHMDYIYTSLATETK